MQMAMLYYLERSIMASIIAVYLVYLNHGASFISDDLVFLLLVQESFPALMLTAAWYALPTLR